MSDWNEQIIAEFRANEGRVGGPFADNRLLLLHTVGAKTGEPRVNPLVTIEAAGRLVVIASAGGADKHPDWYHNLLATPEVEVEYGKERFVAWASVAEEPIRSELYAKMEAAFSNFTEYREKAERTIPVVTLARVR